MSRERRKVSADWGRAERSRVPLLGLAKHQIEMGEPVMVEHAGDLIPGVIAWDLRLGWVCVLYPSATMPSLDVKPR